MTVTFTPEQEDFVAAIRDFWRPASAAPASSASALTDGDTRAPQR